MPRYKNITVILVVGINWRNTCSIVHGGDFMGESPLVDCIRFIKYLLLSDWSRLAVMSFFFFFFFVQKCRH